MGEFHHRVVPRVVHGEAGDGLDVARLPVSHRAHGRGDLGQREVVGTGESPQPVVQVTVGTQRSGTLDVANGEQHPVVVTQQVFR